VLPFEVQNELECQAKEVVTKAIVNALQAQTEAKA